MKKILMSLATVGALSALITGASFALFTAQAENQNNTFTAGTVKLGEVTTFDCGIETDNLAPGDSGTCEVSVTYSGSLEAFIGVEHSASGALFKGSTPMTYTINGSGDSGTILLGKAKDGDPTTATVAYTFPLEAGNSYQGKSGTISLKFKAVQVRNNEEDGKPKSWN